ncbi:MAG: hypothetical protein DRI36_03660 [Caldiserica bacterium]|nr:MAG: hypothetical protein DRI36_03660 [Caldisericota bacterium]
MRRIIFCFILSLSFIKSYSGVNALPFLRYGIGARAVGMGGAFTGLCNDASSVFWNPAGISGVLENEFNLTTSILSDGRNDNLVLVALPKTGIGFLFEMVGVGDVHGYENGVPSGEFNWDNQVFNITYSKAITDGVQWGLTLKYVMSKLKDEKASSFGFDFGVKAYPSKKISFGFVIKDVASSLKWSTGAKDEIPIYVRSGITFKLLNYKLLTSFDIGKVEGEDKMRYSFGAEYWLAKSFAVRSGYSDNGFSAGISIGIKKLLLEYSFSDEDLSSRQILSLSLKF